MLLNTMQLPETQEKVYCTYMLYVLTSVYTQQLTIHYLHIIWTYPYMHKYHKNSIYMTKYMSLSLGVATGFLCSCRNDYVL